MSHSPNHSTVRPPFVSYPIFWAKGLSYNDTVSNVGFLLLPSFYSYGGHSKTLSALSAAAHGQRGAEPTASFFPFWSWLAFVYFPASKVEASGRGQLRIVGTNWSKSQEQRMGCPLALPGAGIVLSFAQLGYHLHLPWLPHTFKNMRLPKKPSIPSRDS